MRWWTDICVLLFITMAMRQRKRHSLGQKRGKKRRRYRRRKQQHGKGILFNERVSDYVRKKLGFKY